LLRKINKDFACFYEKIDEFYSFYQKAVSEFSSGFSSLTLVDFYQCPQLIGSRKTFGTTFGGVMGSYMADRTSFPKRV
jgi:hypothetical protein